MREAYIENFYGETCEMCGGSLGPIAPADQDWCKCDSITRRCQEALDLVDPEAGMTFGNYAPDTDEQKKALGIAMGVASGAKRGCLLLGDPGVGKTHLGVSALRKAIEEGQTAAYENVVSLVSRIQATYGGEEGSRGAIIEALLKCKLVMLDDLGKERMTEDVASIVYEVINAVYGRGTRVIVCSNLTGEEYLNRYDSAVRSRMAGMCERMVVSGSDRRRI